MNKLKLEVGKAYKTRDGRKAIILEKVGYGSYPLTVAIECTDCEDGWLIEQVTWNGYVYSGGAVCGHDIVGEWVEPLDFDWDCLPAWANKAIAMDSNWKWFCYGSKPVKVSRGYWDLVNDTAYGFIPTEYAPKNFTGSWEDSLFINPKYQEEK